MNKPFGERNNGIDLDTAENEHEGQQRLYAICLPQAQHMQTAHRLDVVRQCKKPTLKKPKEPFFANARTNQQTEKSKFDELKIYNE